MPEVTVAPNLPVVALLPAGAGLPADGLDPAAALAAGIDFAAVLRQQLGQATQGEGAEAILALLGEQAGDQAQTSGDDTAAAPDLAALLPSQAALLPGLAALLPGLAAATPGAPVTETGDAPTVSPAPSALIPLQSTLPGTPLAVESAVTGNPVVTQPASGETRAIAQAAVEFGGTPARQPAVIAVAEQATAETAVSSPPIAATADPVPFGQIVSEIAAAPAHAAATAGHGIGHSQAPAPLRVDTPVGARGWEGEVGQKLVWLVSRDESRAELTLTPPSLGRVEVTISVSGDQTNALFVSASPVAREALEQALPRLREVLADAGITLGQASVNAESPRRDRGEEGSGTGGGRGVAASAPAPVGAAAGTRSGRGLIDTFA